jgi:hypothetical protein
MILSQYSKNRRLALEEGFYWTRLKDYEEMALKSSTKDLELFKIQSEMFGRFDHTRLIHQHDGSVLVGSAEQSFLALFRKYGIDSENLDRGYFAHTSCFRDESDYDAMTLFEFDKVEVCYIFHEDALRDENGVEQYLWSHMHPVLKLCQKIYDRFEDPSLGYFAPSPTMEKVACGNGFMYTKDINLVTATRQLETHSLVLYDMDLSVFKIKAPEGTRLLFHTLMAFPRFLRPYQGHILSCLP